MQVGDGVALVAVGAAGVVVLLLAVLLLVVVAVLDDVEVAGRVDPLGHAPAVRGPGGRRGHGHELGVAAAERVAVLVGPVVDVGVGDGRVRVALRDGVLHGVVEGVERVGLELARGVGRGVVVVGAHAVPVAAVDALLLEDGVALGEGGAGGEVVLPDDEAAGVRLGGAVLVRGVAHDLLLRDGVEQVERVDRVGLGHAPEEPVDGDVLALALDALALGDLARGDALGRALDALGEVGHAGLGVELGGQLVGLEGDGVALVGGHLDARLEGLAHEHVDELVRDHLGERELDVARRGGLEVLGVREDVLVAHELPVEVLGVLRLLGEGDREGAVVLAVGVLEDVGGDGDGHVAGLVVELAGEGVVDAEDDGLLLVVVGLHVEEGLPAVVGGVLGDPLGSDGADVGAVEAALVLVVLDGPDVVVVVRGGAERPVLGEERLGG